MQELLKNFGIEWQLLLAQAVNFLVLLVVLRKFAYQPVLKMLRSRREEIKRGIEASKESEDKLANIKIIEEKKIAEANEKALATVNSAEAIAKEERKNILDDAKKKSDAVLAEAKKVAEREKVKIKGEVEKETSELVSLGVARVLAKMNPEMRDRELVRLALEELKTVV